MTTTGDLIWTDRVLAWERLRRNLNGHRRVVLQPGTVVTPLAVDELRSSGVELLVEHDKRAVGSRPWGCAQDLVYAVVQSALQALERERVEITALPVVRDEDLARWARSIGECVARGTCCGGVVFCQDPGLVCCVANKIKGLRAAPVTTIAQAAKATLTLGSNLLAVEMPGRTFFEVRQMIHQLCAGGPRACPERVAATLRELETDAHR